MFKSIQIRIMLILIILAIVMFAIGGFFFVNKLQTIQGTQTIIEQTKLLIILMSITFLIVSVIIVIFASKIIVSPITKLIKKAQKIASGEEVDIRQYRRRKNKHRS